MWSYSAGNPQRPQAKEQIQEFHSCPPPARQMCRLQCVAMLCMSALRETRSDAYFKHDSKKEGGASPILMLVACLIWQKSRQGSQKPGLGPSRFSRTTVCGKGQESASGNEGALGDGECLRDEVTPVRLEGQPSVRAMEACLRCWTHLNN